MDPICSNFNLIKKLEVKNKYKISLKNIKDKKNTLIEKNKFELYVKANEKNVSLDNTINVI